MLYQLTHRKITIMRKLLAILLFISGLMPLYLGILCLASTSNALEMLKLANSSIETSQAVMLFGICLLPLAFLHFIAGYWIWKEEPQGIFLARFTGSMLILSGLLMYFVLHRSDLAPGDLLKGLIIIILAFLIKDKK